MKKGMYCKSVLPLLLLVAATGCTQPTEEVHYIKVDMIACSFQGTDAVPVRITISSNPGPWSAEPSASWIRITEQTEEGIVLTADDNPASTEREGEITVTAGEMTKTIRVTQTGDTFVPARYDVFRDYTMGAVISPNGRYTTGFIGVPDENATNHWLLQVVITDLKSGEQYLPAPFLDSLYPLYDPCAITDSGNVFFHCEDGKIVMFSLSGDVTVLDNIPGAGKPWLSQVASDESGVWVGFCLGGETLYSPVKWTDGVPEILQKPETTYRGYGWYQGCMARGCSLDGTVIYGTAWEGLDSGLMWWDAEGNVRWVGDELHKIKPVQMFDKQTQTYYDTNLVDGIKGNSTPNSISPSGQWIAGTYQTEELSENKPEIIYTACPAFYDTDNDRTYTFPEYSGAAGLGATDDGIGIIGMDGVSGIVSSTVLIDIATGVQISESTDWIYENMGIIIPSYSYLEYISPDGQVAFGYDLLGTGGEMMRKWYVAPKPQN